VGIVEVEMVATFGFEERKRTDFLLARECLFPWEVQEISLSDRVSLAQGWYFALAIGQLDLVDV
jgi:hypothetical protein